MEPTPIILSGIPGKMCTAVAMLAQEPEHAAHVKLATFGLGYALRKGKAADLGGGVQLRFETVTDLQSLLTEPGMKDAIVVDYTTPSAAPDNIRAYAAAGVPFVMGTTGFDRDEAVRIVRESGVSAVIAPNMAGPIVMLQSALNDIAARFPGALDGFSLSIHESHQSTKKDASGTAKALLSPLRKLGCTSVDPEMQSVRDIEQQRALGVPEEHLRGHGWHWYEARSPRGDVVLELSHRINGRRVYAEGTLRAVEFLKRCRAAGLRGGVYTMSDVLKG